MLWSRSSQVLSLVSEANGLMKTYNFEIVLKMSHLSVVLFNCKNSSQSNCDRGVMLESVKC